MGWLGRVVRRQMGIEGLERDAAQVAARVNVLARGAEDRRRMPRQDDTAPVARWRWSAGRWERWSFIEEGFVADDPPQTLVDHVASTGGPEEGRELRLVEGTWRAADEEPAAGARGSAPLEGPSPTEGDGAAPATRDEAARPTSAPTGSGDRSPAAGPTTEEAQPGDVAAQIEAWRRRST